MQMINSVMYFQKCFSMHFSLYVKYDATLTLSDSLHPFVFSRSVIDPMKSCTFSLWLNQFVFLLRSYSSLFIYQIQRILYCISLMCLSAILFCRLRACEGQEPHLNYFWLSWSLFLCRTIFFCSLMLHSSPPRPPLNLILPKVRIITWCSLLRLFK
jgi:hypothetical protein